MSLKETVAKNSTIDGECRIWGGTVNRLGRPYAYPTINGERKGIDLQLFLARKKFNLSPTTRVSITTTCGNPRCISMKHIEIGAFRGGRKKGYRKRGTKVANIDLNMQVFQMLVTQKRAIILDSLDIFNRTYQKILSNSAMLPYFQMCIQWHVGETLSALREKGLSENDLQTKYNLSTKAVRYVLSKHNYPIADEDLYLRLLKQCEVLGEHLVWCGEFKQDVPVYATFGGVYKNVLSQMYSVCHGAKLEIVNCSCGQENCVNPFHLE